MTGQAGFEGWTPIRLLRDEQGLRADWCRFGGRRYTEPFFEDSVTAAMREPFNQAFRRESSLAEVVEWVRVQPGLAPSVFIFHASRCGSTLLAQMLAALPRFIVASEPAVLDACLRYRSPGLQDAERIAWLQALISALAQPGHGETHFAVKFDAWSIFEFDLIRRAYPETPCIYLYRDPAEIAASQLAMRGSYMVPGMLKPSPFGFGQESFGWTAEEYICCALGMMLEQGRKTCATGQMVPVNYTELPDLAWSGLLPLFQLPDDTGARQSLQEAGGMDAKNPGRTFARPGQREVSEKLRREVDRLAGPAYIALEALRAQRVL